MVNPFQPSVAFHIETSHLISKANQMTGFYVKCNTGLKWVNLFIPGVAKNLVEQEIKLNVFQFVGHEMIFRKISVEDSFIAKLHALHLQNHLKRIPIWIFSYKISERFCICSFQVQKQVRKFTIVHIFLTVNFVTGH